MVISRHLSGWRADIAEAVRQFRRSTRLSALIVAILAIGIGGDLAAAAALKAALSVPLAFPNSQQLIVVALHRPSGEATDGRMSYPIFRELVRAVPSLHQAALFLESDATLTGAGDPRLVHTQLVRHDFFETCAVSPVRGRIPDGTAFDSGHGGILISYRLWKDDLGGSAAVVGRELTLDGVPYRIAGVMPDGFAFPRSSAGDDVSVWQPMPLSPALKAASTAFWGDALARMQPNSRLEDVQHQLQSLATALQTQPGLTGVTLSATRLRTVLFGSAEDEAIVLFSAVTLVLIMGCVNIAGLLLVRSHARSREFAIRAAVGAEPIRLIRQLLAEAVLLTVAGVALAAPVCFICFRVLRAWFSQTLTVDPFFVNPWLVAYVVALAAVTCLAFGAAPAVLQPSVRRGVIALGSGRDAGADRGSKKARTILVCLQCAVAMILIAHAALTARTLAHLTNVPLGFQPDDVLAASVKFSPQRLSTASGRAEVVDQILGALRRQPGVTNAAATLLVFQNRYADALPVSLPGGGATQLAVTVDPVSPSYFSLMGVPILRGRAFTDNDRLGSESVVIINSTLARLLWPGQPAVGKRLAIGTPVRWMTVAGVAGDMHRTALTRPVGAEAFVPLAQAPPFAVTVVVRGFRGVPNAADLRRAVWSVDGGAAIWEVRSLDHELDAMLAVPTKQVQILAGFAGLALLLGVLGLYGLIQVSILSIRHELGIRAALGATRRHMLWLIVRHGFIAAVLGICAGGALSIVLLRTLDRTIAVVGSFDLGTMEMSAAALLVAAASACWRPAWRASHADPALVLLTE